MEEISKTEYKLCKIIIKYVPYIIGIWSFIASILSCFGLECSLGVMVFQPSLLPFICLFACSKLLKFCIWHRLPLYYSILIDVINAIDYYIVIPISSKWMILIYLLITGCFVLYGVWQKEKYNRLKKKDFDGGSLMPNKL